MRMFCGFTSRWMMPRSWAWASPAAASAPTRESIVAVRPSRRNLELTFESSRPAARILMATGRSRISSRPKNTVDMPPEPISRTSTNLPPRGFIDALRNPPPRLDDLPAHRAREGLQYVLEAKQRLDRQRLLPVTQGLARIV